MKINFHSLPLLIVLCAILLIACGADKDIGSLDE